jgi:predicted  nucleic acid-binding Zn-ribbon protein
MNTEPIYIIDESVSQDDANYNPMMDPSIDMENYIEIHEKELPGTKAHFNNVADVKTKEVLVTGLLLNFSQDLHNSQLRTLLGRTNMEVLNLYADTIIINKKLVFPQTNVTITCRHLIIDEMGSVSTVPELNPQPYAVGDKKEPRKAGADGEPGGNITLLCQTIENKRTDGAEVFFVNGAKGQDGEMGDLREKKSDGNYPVKWDKVKETILNSELISSEKQWAWPPTDNTDKLYFIEIEICNIGLLDKNKRFTKTQLGDKNKQNEDNGADAIASGNGGNGGPAGKLSHLPFNKTGKDVTWGLKGGAPGISQKIEGSRTSTNPRTFYHYAMKVWHRDLNYDLNKLNPKNDMNPWYTQIGVVSPRNGNDAKGNDGSEGAKGSAEQLPADKNSWLHPLLLETMLQFAKTAFRDGERNRAKWILNKYTDAVKKLPAGLSNDARVTSCAREIDLYLKRLAQNLDFYGYPPGWIPRLSVLSNLQVLSDSRQNLAQLIFFGNRLLDEANKSKSKADDLNATIDQIRNGLTNARNDITRAFAELPGVKNKIAELEGQIKVQLGELNKLKKKITDEIKDQEQAQAIFTGSFKILAGVCALVPVGQPYVGQLGGGILDRISQIDINAENPLKEGMSFAGSLSKDVEKFHKDNEKTLKADINASLNKEIEKSTGQLNDFDKDITGTQTKLAEAETALTKTFGQREISLLRDKMTVIRDINAGRSNSFSVKEDYGDIIAYIDEVQQGIDNDRDITQGQKKELTDKLALLKKDKKDLAADLKAKKAKKAGREKSVETAGKVIKGFTEGLSGITTGIQTMMVEFDENDPGVQKEMEKIMGTKYKTEFEVINKKVAEINKQKLPVTEQLLKLEQKISSGVQYINNNLVQWYVLNEQRVQEEHHELLPATRLYLKGMVQQSWDMLMQECYYLTKSYQYRFLERIQPFERGLKELISDINEFLKNGDPAKMTEAQFKDLFDKVLKRQMYRMGYDLLVKLQGTSSAIEDTNSTIVLQYKNDKGKEQPEDKPFLDELNTYGLVNFRLEDLRTAKHGTDTWLHYRIKKIIFKEMRVTAEDQDVSFDFGIRHSGDSVLRSAEDKKYYFFTSRSAENKSGKPKPKATNHFKKSDEVIDLQVKSWNAAYNGANRDEDGGPVANVTDSGEDLKLLYDFLRAFDLEKKYDENKQPYKDNYPGGSSKLMLVNYDKAEEREKYKIEYLKFDVNYEVLR